MLAALARLLGSLSPLAVLGRGYAAAFAQDGALITSATQAPPGTLLSLALRKGGLDCTVTSNASPQLPASVKAALGFSVDSSGSETLESRCEEADRGRREEVRADDPGGRQDG